MSRPLNTGPDRLRTAAALLLAAMALLVVLARPTAVHAQEVADTAVEIAPTDDLAEDGAGPLADEPAVAADQIDADAAEAADAADLAGVEVEQVGEIEVRDADGNLVDADSEADGTMPLWLALLITAACIIVPLLLGGFIAKQLKMREYGGRIGITLLAITLAVAPFAIQLFSGQSLRDAIRLGIDLKGGANMVFAVDRDKLEKELTGEIMDRMVGAIGRRIDPAGTQELTVRRVGPDRIEVIVPGVDAERTETIKASITRLGSLEFAILADQNQKRHSRVIRRAVQEPGTEVRDGEGRVIGLWRQIGVRGDGTEVDFRPGPGTVGRQAIRDGEEVIEFLLVVDPNPDRRITGRLLKRASEEFDPAEGPVVGFEFNTKGGSLFQQLTTTYRPVEGTGQLSRLAILLDDKIQSAPTINAVITTRGTISGDFTPAERKSLIDVLNAGALEVPLIREPVFESTVSPTLGADVQEKGKWAIAMAAIAVFAFMLFYYRSAGVIADICLVINILLVLGVMALIEATFTLPGLAGLVLTIGMAVDANVLIFERIREERAKGASLRMSIDKGFGRAFTTIVDANVTTLITAVVLYMIGTDTIKGFAVTLFIGIVMSMFTALYVGRTIFDIAERKKILKDLSMASIVGKTEFRFLSYRKLAALVSAIVIAVGLGAFALRGADNYDIDFRGGSMVTFRVLGEETVGLETVRELVDAEVAEREAADSTGATTFDVSIEELQLADAEGVSDTLYRLRTTNNDPKAVSAMVAGAFAESGFELPRQEVTYGDFVDVPEADPEATAAPDAFAGGREVELTTSRPMTAIALQAAIEEQLETLEGEADYVDGVTYVRAQPRDEETDETDATREFLVRAIGDVPAADLTTLLDATVADYAASPFFVEVNTFDSQVAGETRWKAVMAMLVSLIAIVAYIWVRFQRITFGLAAVAALVHDVLVVLGAVAFASLLSGTPLRPLLALEDFKINLPMIAAFLTIVGYSLNDTIVVFDRIREVRGKNPNLSADMIDTSLNQTLARTLLTSLTTFLVVLILYVLGGEGIHGFAFCLLMGVIVGTYSSIYVASPVLLYLTNGREKPASDLATTESAS